MKKLFWGIVWLLGILVIAAVLICIPLFFTWIELKATSDIGLLVIFLLNVLIFLNTFHVKSDKN